jgi:tetratricopeptide (TPR) repeat protein
MAYRLNGPITAALLAAAVTATGCSKGGDTRDGSRDAAPAGSALSQREPVIRPVKADLETTTVAPAPTPKAGASPGITGPVSFADGEAAYAAGRYGDAAAVFSRYTAEKPDNAWGHFMFGLSAWKSGDFAGAGKAFETALSIDPDHVKSLLNLSRVLLEQNRTDEALDRLMVAGDIDPMNHEVQRLLGRAFSAQGKTDDAIDAYRRAIELDATDAWSMNNLGLIFLEQGKAGEAAPLLAKAVEIRTDVPAFHNNLGMALEHTGQFAKAAEAYSGALAADAGYAKARQNLTRVEAIAGKATAADTAAVAIAPKAPAKAPATGTQTRDDEPGE